MRFVQERMSILLVCWRHIYSLSFVLSILIKLMDNKKLLLGGEHTVTTLLLLAYARSVLSIFVTLAEGSLLLGTVLKVLE